MAFNLYSYSLYRIVLQTLTFTSIPLEREISVISRNAIFINKSSITLDFKRIVNIYDKYGKKLHSTKTKDTELQINVSSYLTGNYYITVSKDNKQSSIGFIKK